MSPARKLIFTLAASLGVVLFFLITHHASRITPSAVQAVEGTLNVTADIASFSGSLTQGSNIPIRTAFGPLRFDYKSGQNTWTTGMLIREGDGNVTIGSGITSSDFSSASKLRVLGTIESTTGGVKFPDGTTQTTAVSATAGLAQGSIVFYNGSSCPTGYNEVTGARGRTVVGLPAAGTLAGTVGTALTNLEDRTHTHTGPSHTHDQNSSGTGDGNPNTAYKIRASALSGAIMGAEGSGSTLNILQSGVSAAGTGASGTAATSNVIPYVQYIVCEAASGAGASGNGWNDLGSTVVLATTGDSVGIGTTSVTSKLTVAGTVESTTGGFKFPDATTQTSAAAGETSGQIAFFAAACPSGWTEYTAARGMYIVGNPASGTLATAVGTALTNLEDRTHTHTGPSHTHTYTDVIAHTHVVTRGAYGGGANYQAAGIDNNQGNLNTGSTGIATGTTAASGTGATGTAATSNVAPYIQLTACQKN